MQKRRRIGRNLFLTDDTDNLEEAETEIVARMPIDWLRSAERESVRFANQMIVQNHAGMYYLSFFSIQPPVTLGTPEEIRKQIEGMHEIVPDCIARMVVSETFVKQIISTLQGQLDQFADKAGQSEQNEDA